MMIIYDKREDFDFDIRSALFVRSIIFLSLLVLQEYVLTLMTLLWVTGFIFGV